ncbi:hypothetical protein SAMN05216338_1016120 [Bradyrhizobium sp. Rc2d]|nr:hypothetical protein SAMN05216338_1016120 [Bradyrhizobium sp. Rc2d]
MERKRNPGSCHKRQWSPYREAKVSQLVIARSRLRRSNPESLRGDRLDCFVALLLAMTESAGTPYAAFPPIYSGSQCSNDLRSVSIATGASPAMAIA